MPEVSTGETTCPNCGRAVCSAFNLPEPSAFQRLACCRNTIDGLRSQAAEREALLARGAELLEQDAKEIVDLRSDLYAAKLSLWKFERKSGFDVNGRTYSDTFGLCSHGVILIRECEQCDAGSGRPRPATDEKETK